MKEKKKTALCSQSQLHLVLCVTCCGSSSEQSLQNTKINISEGLWNLMACVCGADSGQHARLCRWPVTPVAGSILYQL